MDELGVDEETAAFAVALVDGKTTGCVRAISFPQPEDEAHRRAELLVEYLGFTPTEAARYVAGDRTAIDAIAVRRMTEDVGADLTDTSSDTLGSGS
jgi:hypothetical protein